MSGFTSAFPSFCELVATWLGGGGQAYTMDYQGRSHTRFDSGHRHLSLPCPAPLSLLFHRDVHPDHVELHRAADDRHALQTLHAVERALFNAPHDRTHGRGPITSDDRHHVAASSHVLHTPTNDQWPYAFDRRKIALPGIDESTWSSLDLSTATTTGPSSGARACSSLCRMNTVRNSGSLLRLLSSALFLSLY